MANPNKPEASIETITPKLAAELLTRNHCNRPVKKMNIANIKRIITMGQWRSNNDAIVIDRNGRLLNGQHRLMAVVELNVTVRCIVFRGADPDAFSTMDSFSRRSMADRTGLPGTLTADANTLHTIMHGHHFDRSPTPPEIAEISGWWQPAHDAVVQAVNGIRRAGFNSTSVRIGFGMRWALTAEASRREHLMHQYALMMQNNTKDMDAAIASLWQRLSRQKMSSARYERIRLAAVVVYFTDWSKRNVTPLVRSPDEAVTYLKEAVRLMPDAFASSDPTSDHPYRWVTAPTIEREVYGATKQRRDAKRQRMATMEFELSDRPN